ncbi:MAG: hypothetical protein M3N53_14190 [Actinomycetota bacterium]|nr:hypothetical protein [Actinomycetota bacterium]
MNLAALPSDVQTMWWITLGVGLVIALVVVFLLHTLLREVRRIDSNVKTLWSTATMVARNTATTWLLNDTADELEAIKAEALRHDELLNKVTSS